MNRTPDKQTQKILRRENGFKCCVSGCESPYLEYHHFDPPWHISNHHNPEGMIALCPAHHRKADAGVINKEQLAQMKANAKTEFYRVKGDFEWMRRKILLVAGGNFYYNNRVEVSMKGEPLIWFNTDYDGYKMLNLKLRDGNGDLRIHIEDNVWLVKKEVKDIECPPSGKSLKIYFRNGDSLRLHFSECETEDTLIKTFPNANSDIMRGEYPFSILQLSMKLKSMNINFQSRKTLVNGPSGIMMTNCFMRNNGTGLALN